MALLLMAAADARPPGWPCDRRPDGYPTGSAASPGLSGQMRSLKISLFISSLV